MIIHNLGVILLLIVSLFTFTPLKANTNNIQQEYSIIGNSVKVNETIFDSLAMNGNSKYYISRIRKNWQDAKFICEQNGGHLITISDSLENEIAFTGASLNSTVNRVWLGFTDENIEGQWEWITGEPVNYTNWNTGEPNNSGNEDYALLYGDLSSAQRKWNDCNNQAGPWGELYFVLEVPDTILIPSLTLEAPNGGENWQAGSQQNVIWNSYNINHVNIKYSTDNGNNWQSIASNISASQDSIIWIIPNTPSTTCKVKIVSSENSSVFDESDNVFSITNVITPSITVIKPNGAENWEIGTTQNITWSTQNINNVNVSYSIDNGNSWINIANNIPASHQNYVWIIPNTPSTTCKVKIVSSENASIYDISDGVFTISQAVSQELILNNNLTIFANNITSSGNNYTASGNVSINHILQFNGDLTININTPSISGDCKIFLENIPSYGTLDLYEGTFNFSVANNMLNGAGLNSMNNLFQLANLPLELYNIEILTNGIRIDGSLILPEVLGHFQADISRLQITHSNGVELIGAVDINQIYIAKNIELTQLSLIFDTINNNFTGTADLHTTMFGINAGASIKQGRLDSVGVIVQVGNPIPLGSTGFSLSEGGGSLSNISNPPMRLSLMVSLVPTIQNNFNLVELDQLTLAYTLGTRLEGSGGLKIFDTPVANVYLLINRSQIELGGEVDLIGILIGNADAGLFKDLQGQINFEGNMEARLEIPALTGIPFDYISGLIGLPYTVARTENHIRNASVLGRSQITNIFELKYGLIWDGSNLTAIWGHDLNSFNQTLFSSQYLMNDRTQIAKNRLEGQSLIISQNLINDKLQIKNNKMSQTFTLTNQTQLMIIRVQGIEGLPQCTITMPNGALVTPQNVQLFPNIEYVLNSSENKLFYGFKNPLLGEYSLAISGVSTYYLDIFGTNNCPSIEIENIEEMGGSYDIKWHDSDTDDDAQINLYYDSDNSGCNGVMFAQNISENNMIDHFTWTPDSLSSGLYYIYATIQDTSNPIITSYGSNPLKFVTINAPNPPTNLSYTVCDTSIKLNWNSNNPSPINYIVYYDTDNDVNYNSSSFNIGDTNQFNFKNFTPGHTYRMMVTAMDSLYRESDYSNVVEFSYISTTQNNAPTIINHHFQNLAYTNTPYFTQIQAFDADGDILTYTLKQAPSEMTIDNTGFIDWFPTANQIGNHLIEVKVADPAGLSDSTSFRISVIDSLTSRGNISLNKPIYSGYNDNGLITLSDINLNISSSQIDSQQVELYSNSQPQGLTLIAKETQANSGRFTVSFGFDPTAGSNTKIVVQPNDSIWVQYYDQFPADTIMDFSTFADSTTTINSNQQFVLNNFSLNNAYPNPFNPIVFIEYTLPERSEVVLTIYNALGQKVKTLVNSHEGIGKYIVEWDGKNNFNQQVASGLYFYRIEAVGSSGKFIDVKKLILLK